ncbi:TnsD family Tn7-like transposition protein [Pseudomonas sp. 14A]|uniref:TnsD family Tn7-like transposition protein n=1 Tax=Pseudomonas sp. 14A TaxID=2823142 RepID=UPI001B83FAFF|nr:TnsD family Tn7-like transposition protein [Pseudomonas sp. 14A]MBR7200350.1 TniQ family protein [Pseudomonas sp. 14A]
MDHEFHFFPAACPDETLHSLLSRYVRLSGLGSWAAVFNAAQGDGSFARDLPFPCHLIDLVQALPSGANLRLDSIISRHTLLPYYQPFLTEQQLADAQFQMSYRGGIGLKTKLGIIASRLEATSRTRFCQICLVTDNRDYGTAYWHRVHQLPGVWICPRCQVPLSVVDHHWLAKGLRKLSLPQDEDVQAHSSRFLVNKRQHQALLALARSSLHLLDVNAPPQPAALIRQALLNVVIERGLASPSGRLCLSELAHFLHRHIEAFPASGEFLTLKSELDSPPACWVTKILRKPRGTHHPLKYLMLADAFGLDLSRVLRTSGVPSCIPPRRQKVAPCAVQIYASVTEKPAKQSIQRPHVSKQTEEAVWEKAITGAGAEEIARSLKLSVASVYRSIRAVSGGAHRWKQVKVMKERDTRRERFSRHYLSSLAHECPDYSWLYRNDRHWLMAHLGKNGADKRHREPSNLFTELDTLLAEKIIGCALSIRSLSGKPVRVSKTRIGRELDALSRFEKQLDRLPLCADALTSVCESTEDFHRRRLVWATEKLGRLGRPITRAAIYRAASIRPPVV